MRKLTYITALSIALMTTNQAYALSCASTGFDLGESFKANKAAGNNVIYVMGSFSGKQAKQIKQTKNTGHNGIAILLPPKATVSSLIFSGEVMTRNGTKPFKQKVKVTSSCIASWCGTIPKSGQKTIAALTKTRSGYTLISGPCAPNTFSKGLDTNWDRLERLISK